MKKVLAIILIIVATFNSSTVLATSSNKVTYYDKKGNEITVNGLYYNSKGSPMFNSDCYYLDVDGNPVYVGGCRAYTYNSSGKLKAAKVYYNENGKAIARPTSYLNGYGCGRWLYDDNGNIINGTFYYDELGNAVDVTTIPETDSGMYYRGGCCRLSW